MPKVVCYNEECTYNKEDACSCDEIVVSDSAICITEELNETP